MYDQLLGARGAAPHAEALQAPVLRLRLLRSLLYLVHIEAVRLVLGSPCANVTITAMDAAACSSEPSTRYSLNRLRTASLSRAKSVLGQDKAHGASV